MMKLLLILVFFTCAFAYNVGRNRIIRGKTASEGQFPYQVSLRYYRRHHCGGSIINDNTILTAAHCLHRCAVPAMDVVVGALTLNDGTWYDVSRYVMHEDYNLVTAVNDIAVIKLQTSIQYTAKVQPIDVDPNYINAGAKTVTAGWGLTSAPGRVLSYYLLYFYGNVYDLETCKEMLENDINSVKDTNICNFSLYGQGVCDGDSGGGLVVNGKHVGIASWVLECGIGVPDVFTRTSSYIDWINSQ